MTLGEHDGVLDCYHGTQRCVDGAWTACSSGTLSVQAAPAWSLAGLSPLALSVPRECEDNPCNPFCQTFNEEPTSPLEAITEGPSADWSTGASSEYPDELKDKALTTPCTSGSDCQLNHHCVDVATADACAHSKCETGAALRATCDPCVERICEADPACCQRGWDCAHDVCETGVKLAPSCDDDAPGGSCVAEVCASDPSCCSNSWDADCVALAGSLCGADCGSCGPGELTAPDGQSCYYLDTSNKSWTNARTACRARGDGWDLAKIDSSTENTFIDGYVSTDTWLGLNDRSSESTWRWASDDSTLSYTRWASGEPNGGSAHDCARMRGDGYWYDNDCANSYDSLCEGPGPAAASAQSWEQSCVERVASECDAACGEVLPAAEAGQCVAWRPGETDPACDDRPDLGLGIPCGDGSVPVCNHGGAAVPAGVTISYFSASSAQYPACAPDMELAKGSCEATSEAIEPGECINVRCPTNGASGIVEGDTLVVNGDQAVDECSCLDNWSIYAEGLSCGEPECASNSSETSLKPVNMYIVMDRSYSMVCHPPSFPSTCFGPGPGCVCTSERWNGAVSALTSFFESPDAAGVRVAMDFFPLIAGAGAGDGCAGSGSVFPPSSATSSECNPSPCGNALVPLGALTAASAPTDTQEQALINALSTSPVSPPNSAASSTPSLPALSGALDWAVTQQLAQPNETFIVVFVTDGAPTTCLMPGDSFGDTPATNAELARLAEDAYEAAGVRTYAIGMDGADVAVMNTIAAAGGTDQAYVVSGSNSADIATDLADALIQISTQNISCDLPFSTHDLADLATAQVVYRSGGSDTVLTRRTTSADCGSGWYFDDNENPTKVTLCPNTCDMVQSDSEASLVLEIPCASPYEAVTFTEIYQTNCAEGQHPQWGYFGYQTSIPSSDTQVSFRARTADSQADLTSATWHDVSTATEAAPDCIVGVADCPVDLFEVLGDDNNREFLELEITVTPSRGETPSVEDWQITFSCPLSE